MKPPHNAPMQRQRLAQPPASGLRQGRLNDHIPQPQGFTLVELMVTLAILVILVALAAPSLTQMVQRQAVESRTQSLVADLKLARSEAIKRGVQVTLTSPSTVAKTGGYYDWASTGWVVNDGTSTIKAQQLTLGVGAVKSTVSAITFNPTGILSNLGGLGIASIVINPSDTGNTSAAQIICIATTGRPRVVKGSASGAAPTCPA